MRQFDTLRLRVRSLFHRRAVERELDNEIRFHLDQLMEEEIAGGRATPASLVGGPEWRASPGFRWGPSGSGTGPSPVSGSLAYRSQPVRPSSRLTVRYLPMTDMHSGAPPRAEEGRRRVASVGGGGATATRL